MGVLSHHCFAAKSHRLHLHSFLHPCGYPFLSRPASGQCAIYFHAASEQTVTGHVLCLLMGLTREIFSLFLLYYIHLLLASLYIQYTRIIWQCCYIIKYVMHKDMTGTLGALIIQQRNSWYDSCHSSITIHNLIRFVKNILNVSRHGSCRQP